MVTFWTFFSERFLVKKKIPSLKKRPDPAAPVGGREHRLPRAQVVLCCPFAAVGRSGVSAEPPSVVRGVASLQVRPHGGAPAILALVHLPA